MKIDDIAFIILYTIPQAIVFWRLYVKAGRPGWAYLVPVYGTIVMANIAKKSTLTGVIASIFSLISLIGIFFPIYVLALFGLLALPMLISIGFALYVLNSFIKQYNRGIGWWVLAIFLPFIAVFLSNDKTQYTGGAKPAPADPNAPAAPQAQAPVPQQSQPTDPVQSVVAAAPAPAPQPNQNPQPSVAPAPQPVPVSVPAPAPAPQQQQAPQPPVPQQPSLPQQPYSPTPPQDQNNQQV